MQPWRRKMILTLAARPLRLVAFSVGLFTLAGLLFAFLMTRGGPVVIHLPEDRAWQQPIVDALGGAGYIYAVSVVPCIGIGLLFAPFLYALVRLSAGQLRAQDAAAAARAPTPPPAGQVSRPA